MARSQLELLVLYQDVSLMLSETEEEEKKMGFSVEGKEKLLDARNNLAKSIKPKYFRTYERLATRYSHSIAPVQNGTCLGCFAKLPTSFTGRGSDENIIFFCEQCGRILYWLNE